MTRDLPSDLDVEYELTRFVRRVRGRSMQAIGTIHPRLDYGTFMFLLAIVDAPAGIRGSELADGFGVHKSTASRAVAQLVRLGLVSRVQDPDDGRAQLLVAEDGARASVRAYRDRGHSIVTEALSDWTPQEVAEFARSLGRLNDVADRL